uniref:RNA-directed RNA polymerase L n=1 Tax=Phytophthora palustris bunya-like virus 6 TaxID=2976285 RepID=A0A9E8YWW6_9VIRU|nr:RNA-dependent RNA polymerase [Phytophthora palustris bunya-like virus 6]
MEHSLGPGSPLSQGLALHTEDTTLDVNEMLMSLGSDEASPSSPILRETLLEIIRLSSGLLEREEVNHDDIIPLAVYMGRMAKKLEFTMGKAAASTIRHTYGLATYALHLQESGCKILLFESCDGNRVQRVQDVDLLYEKDGKTIACDYTQKTTDYSGTYIKLPFKMAKNKYRVLKMADISDEIEVVSCNLPERYLRLKTVGVRKFTDCPREDDFSQIDHLTANVGDLTWDDAIAILNNYSDQYVNFSSERSTMVQTPGCYSSHEDYVAAMSTIRTNDTASAESYEKFRHSLNHSLHESKNMRSKAEEYFSLSSYTKVAQPSKPVRWLQPLPSVKRGLTTQDPFERLDSIVRTRVESGLPVDALTVMISMLHTRDLVTKRDILVRTTSKYDDIMDAVEVRRCYAKGTKMDAYSLQLRKGVTGCIGTLFDKMRDLNKTKQEPLPVGKELSHLENQFAEYKTDMLSTGTGSYLLDDVSCMIDDVLEDGPLAEVTRLIMRKGFNTVSSTSVMSQLAFTQEVTMSLLTGARKRQRYHRSCGGFADSRIVMGLTCVADRQAVVSHNLGPLTFGGFKDVTYLLHGNLSPVTSSGYAKIHEPTVTSPLSMSPAQLDWNITLVHKALSWVTNRYETCMANFPDRRSSVPSELVMPLSMMFLNSNTFSQAADMLRYFFVNGVGYTSGVGPLFSKISWYKPKTYLESLYVLRMFKMSDMMSVAKNLNMTEKLVVKSHVSIHEIHDLKMTFKVSGWLIAMPDESESYLSQQHTFNSFYNSRALTIQRYQKLASEALVVEKQLDARDEYLMVKRADLASEARFLNLDHDLSAEELKQDLMSYNYVDSPARVFSPCPRVSILGFLATTLKVRDRADATVGETVRSMYQTDQVHRRMTVSSVMNNRGSVRSSATNGVVVTKVKLQGKNKSKITQNSKCYRTILELLDRFLKRGTVPKAASNYSDIIVDEEPDDQELKNLETMVNMPDNLAIVLVWLANNHAACVSKMVHKDQLGAREIAVLNALSRVMCRYVEDCSRHIRDCNLSRGERTNLIEVSDKTDIVLSAKRRSDAQKRNRVVMYDSADCSKWGPSIMMHDLYSSIKMRFPSSHMLPVLRNCLTLFGSKVFKIPDELYLLSKSGKMQGGKVSEVIDRLRTMDPEVGCYEKQLIYLEESMHQGILGVSSSVKGADAHNLSNYVLTRVQSSCQLAVETYSTSDDYSRILSWEKHSRGTFSMLKDTLSIHYHILTTAGIKRNLQKSTISKDYFEFNSEFFTTMGEIKPDIKSRLSFVDVASQEDPYPVSLRAMNQAVEYLRSETSVVGASWIHVLNNALAMYSNQSRVLWKSLGRGIYQVPLELGGLVRPDVLKETVSHVNVGIADNYGGLDNLPLTFSMLADSSPFTSPVTEIDEGGEMRLIMPSLSRSGTIHMCRRSKRSTRALEEFLLSVDPKVFEGAHNSRHGSNLVYALMACAQRERNSSGVEGSALRFMVTQTPSDLPIYRVNSRMLAGLTTKTLVTRNELHDMATTFFLSDHKSYPSTDWPLNYEVMYQDIKVYKDTMHHLKPASMSPIPRIGHTHVRRQTFSNQTYVIDSLARFEEQNLPKSLGGDGDLHPWRYLESKMTYSNFLNRLTVRRQGFRMILRERDQLNRNFTEMNLVTNFMGGCRLHYTFDHDVTPQTPIDATLTTLLPVLEPEFHPSSNGLRINLYSPGLRQLLEQGKVKTLDVTDLMNTVARSNSFYIRSQELQMTILNKLMMSNFRNNLVVDPRRLARGFPESRFKSAEGIMTYQRNESTDIGLAGRHIIIQSGGTYEHYMWGTYGTLTEVEGSDTDIYTVTNVSEMYTLSVTLQPVMGFLMLVEKFSKDPIQILSQNVISTTAVNLYMSKALAQNSYLIERLSNRSLEIMDNVEMVSYYQASRGLVNDPVDPEEESEHASEYSGGLDSDSDDSEDSFFNSDCDEEYVAPVLMTSLPVPDKQSDSDSVSSWERESSSDGEESAPVSSQSSIRQPEGILVSAITASASGMPGVQCNKASKRLGFQVVQGLTVSLPLNLGIKYLADTNGSNSIKELYQMVEDLDELDRKWMLSALDQCFMSIPEVAAELAYQRHVGPVLDDDDFEL